MSAIILYYWHKNKQIPVAPNMVFEFWADDELN